MKAQKMISTAFLLTGITFLLGCAASTTQTRIQEPTYQDVSYAMPSLVSAEGSVQDQIKDNIRISCTAEPFIAEKAVRQSYRQLGTLFVVNRQYPYEVTDIPYYTVKPEALRFKFKVNNNMKHILKLEGTVLSFKVAGQKVAVNKSGYDQFLAGIILPRQEMEFEITGPLIASLPANCTVVLSLYDVISDTDAAGNPSKKTSFEWFYSFNKQNVAKSEPVTTRKIKMTPEEAVSVGAPFKQ